MTHEEAGALRTGDRILFRNQKSKDLIAALVISIVSRDYLPAPIVYFRCEGQDRIGRPHPTRHRYADDIVRVPNCDRLSANVYADWLDEVGEARAAAKLRLAFPLDDGKKGG